MLERQIFDKIVHCSLKSAKMTEGPWISGACVCVFVCRFALSNWFFVIEVFWFIESPFPVLPFRINYKWMNCVRAHTQKSEKERYLLIWQIQVDFKWAQLMNVDYIIKIEYFILWYRLVHDSSSLHIHTPHLPYNSHSVLAMLLLPVLCCAVLFHFPFYFR